MLSRAPTRRTLRRVGPTESIRWPQASTSCHAHPVTARPLWLSGPNASQATLLDPATGVFTIYAGADLEVQTAGFAQLASDGTLTGWLILEEGGPLCLLIGSRIIPFSQINSCQRQWRWHRLVSELTVKLIGEAPLRVRDIDWNREVVGLLDIGADELEKGAAEDHFGDIERIFRDTATQRYVASRLSPTSGPWHLCT